MAGKLLDLVLDAHGGMNRWSELSDLIVDTTLGGSLWAQVGVPTILPNVRLSLSLKRQHVMMHSDTAKERMLFDSFGMSLFAPEQRPLRLEDPRQSIMERPGYPWTELQAGYFIGYAMWQYLTAPFLYSYPGFQTEEVEAWHEGGETWRVLRITFPDHIETHTNVQYAYYGPDGLLRRHRYAVDILGGIVGVNYASAYQQINGIMVPTVREVFAADIEGNKIGSPPVVTIKLDRLFFQ
ncbi:hypothetical protein [Granulicella arctica]|uniref:hypothetical protein n=1 Tax=Granulicella arctica TaxID=940613 RepID=UPI0021E005C6|nr:hypothetical protein [Granulicella arctica]